MKLKEIVTNTDFDSFYQCLLEHYDRAHTIEKDRIRTGYEDLKRLEAHEGENEFTILIQIIEENGEKYFDVSGVEKNDSELYSLVFAEWEEWLAYDIDKENLRSFSNTEILVHCYWEMSWMGWNYEEVKKNGEILRFETELREEYMTHIEELKMKNALVEDTFLKKMLDSYVLAKTENLKTDIEIMIEELLESSMLTVQQVDAIRHVIQDEDVIIAIESVL